MHMPDVVTSPLSLLLNAVRPRGCFWPEFHLITWATVPPALLEHCNALTTCMLFKMQPRYCIPSGVQRTADIM